MRMIIPLVQKHCINGIDKQDAKNLKDIPSIEDGISDLDERVTALEQGGSGGSDEYVLFDNVRWSELFDINGIALYDMKILVSVPVYSDTSTLLTHRLAVVEIMKGLEYSQQISIDEFECYVPYNTGTNARFIAYDFMLPDGLFFNDTSTGSDIINYYKKSYGENDSWYNVSVTFTKKTRITSPFMESGEVYLYVKNYNPNPYPR